MNKEEILSEGGTTDKGEINPNSQPQTWETPEPTITRRETNDVVILDYKGDMRGTKSLVKKAVQKELDHGTTKLLFNLEETSYIDSGGLGVLITALNRAHQHNVKIALLNIQDEGKINPNSQPQTCETPEPTITRRETTNGLVILDYKGDMRGTKSLVKKAVQKELDNGTTKLLFNLEETSYIDSGGLGVLITALNRAREHNIKIALLNIQGPRSPIIIARLKIIVECYSSEEEALHALSAQPQTTPETQADQE